LQFSEELGTLFEARAVPALSGSGHYCLFPDELGLVPGFRFGSCFPRTKHAAKYFGRIARVCQIVKKYLQRFSFFYH
jgi:hypothetical protein